MITTTDTGTVTAIKKGTGLDGILDEHKAQDVDEVQNLEVGGESKGFNKLFSVLEKYLDLSVHEAAQTKINHVLPPEDINLFLAQSLAFENKILYHFYIGYFISDLIQASYEAGHNDFVFNTKPLINIKNLGSDLKGTEDNPIRLTVYGDTGDNLGCLSRYCNFVVNGNVSDCGSNSQYSHFEINGNVNESCGYTARNSEFVINGTLGKTVFFGAEMCTFRIKYREDSDNLGSTQQGNRIYLINPDGDDILLRGKK